MKLGIWKLFSNVSMLGFPRSGCSSWRVPFKGGGTGILGSMHPSKAPGSDSMPASFFQKFWHIIGNDILSFVLNILNNNASPACINETFIALIPSCTKDFLPISLCNVVYKLVSKTVTNRLKMVLLMLIHKS